MVACMTQLVHLELGIIFDGSSAHHDVPRAVESLGNLQKLQVGMRVKEGGGALAVRCSRLILLAQRSDSMLREC